MAHLLLAHPLFLALDAQEQEAASPYFPLGILYLASWVREHGHTVAVFDGTFSSGPEAFAERLATERPDIVGISAVISNRDHALELADIASATDAVVIVGGPDPTQSAAAYLAQPSVDLVVHHEGEVTLTRLLDLCDEGGLSIEAIADEPGLAWRVDGKTIVTPPRAPIEDLDTLPVPARDLIDMDRYLHQWQDERGYTSVTVATGRGCPFGCSWCAGSVHGTEFRQRSPESVAAEMAELSAAWNVDSIRVVDDIDGIDEEWFAEWAQSAEARDPSIRFEPLQRTDRTELPLLEVRDSL